MKNIAYALFVLALLSALGVQNVKALECTDLNTVTFFCDPNTGADSRIPLTIHNQLYQGQYLKDMNCKAEKIIFCKLMNDSDKRTKITAWANSPETRRNMEEICEKRGGRKYKGKWRAHQSSRSAESPGDCTFTN
jgi:hypothetical protein